MDFTAPTLGGAVKAVLLPHLHAAKMDTNDWVNQSSD